LPIAPVHKQTRLNLYRRSERLRPPIVQASRSQMPLRAIVSYDGTDNDADAVVLGAVFRRAGAELALAYVRHATEPEEQREVVERDKAGRLVDAGAALLGPPAPEEHVVLSASTPEGLSMLADDLGADLIVFGSEYRTPEGRVQPGTSAERLLEGGRTAVAIAPAGMRHWSDARLGSVGAVGEMGDDGAAEVAADLAAALGGTVVDSADEADLLVVGSRPEGTPGQILLAAPMRQELEEANLTVPVLVLPVAPTLRFSG
jgi:nucleotide-binding universal stress UspA family protein